MTASPHPADENLAARVTELEILLTHMQAEFQQLNSAVLDQQQQLDAINKQLDLLGHRVDKLAEDPEKRDPNQERPPHY